MTKVDNASMAVLKQLLKKANELQDTQNRTYEGNY